MLRRAYRRVPGIRTGVERGARDVASGRSLATVVQPSHHLRRIGVRPGPLDHVARRHGGRTAEYGDLVGLRPLPAELRHDLELNVEPQWLGVDEEPVHVEEDGLELRHGGALHSKTGRMKGTFTRTYGVRVPFMRKGGGGQALKYLASGW